MDPAGIRTGTPGGGESSRWLQGEATSGQPLEPEACPAVGGGGRPSDSELRRRGSDQHMVGERRRRSAMREKRGLQLPTGSAWWGEEATARRAAGPARPPSVDRAVFFLFLQKIVQRNFFFFLIF